MDRDKQALEDAFVKLLAAYIDLFREHERFKDKLAEEMEDCHT